MTTIRGRLLLGFDLVFISIIQTHFMFIEEIILCSLPNLSVIKNLL